jgi:hypothetical protein
MAKETTPKKRATSRQKMAELVSEAETELAERREVEAKPDERAAAKAAGEAVAVADALSSEGVIRSIGELKSTIGRTLTQLSDRLEEEVGKYNQIRRAISAKETELKEIYEIQRSATTLLAFIETHERKRAEMERDLETERQALEQEIDATRAAWQAESKQREQETKDRETAEQKRRQREQEEYKYAFVREQQVAKDQFNDEVARQQKELAERKAALEREWAEREQALATGERELAELRARVAGLPKELAAAADRAAKETAERLTQQHGSAIELMRREAEGQQSVSQTKIAALEQTVKEQAEQLSRLQQQAERAYAQVQEIAVRAIEGSGSAKQLASLQQMLAEQSRKGGASER